MKTWAVDIKDENPLIRTGETPVLLWRLKGEANFFQKIKVLLVDFSAGETPVLLEEAGFFTTKK